MVFGGEDRVGVVERHTGVLSGMAVAVVVVAVPGTRTLLAHPSSGSETGGDGKVGVSGVAHWLAASAGYIEVDAACTAVV